MSQESTDDQQVRELAAAVGHGAGGEAMKGLLREALQIPNLGLRRGAAVPPIGNVPPPEDDDRVDEDVDIDDEPLPAGGFLQIDLLSETLHLFHRTKRLLGKVIRDSKTPVNQKAQVANSLNNLLKSLAEQQLQLYNAERLKRLEAITISILRDLAPEVQDEFLRRYETEMDVR